MLNQQVIVSNTWSLVSDNIDYILQVTSGNVFVKADTSIPTVDLGSFELEKGHVINSQLLSGKIYVKAVGSNLAYISLAI